jgi:tetratricopeptide (TPR) repeat protein
VASPELDGDLAQPLARAGRAADAAVPWTKHKIKAALFGEPAPPLQVGPYEIHGELGRGGMGMVLDGFDPRLGRRVAVKLLSPSLGRDDAAMKRLLREAQAMARLSHPNVVQVYETGTTDDGHVFVAMERVEGQTLLAWQKAARRDWRACLAKYLEAGEGLAAAHAEGLVHRDFKPANCMVDEEGRVRVLDFGLAQSLEGGSEPPAEVSGPSHDSAPEQTRLTRPGAVVGTLAYMAPEQLAGEATDARSDQFSFCVALFEALCGRRPFGGESVSDRYEGIRRGRTRPRSSRVPRRLLELVRRGLAFDPGLRHSDLASLLRALRGYPIARRRWRVGGVAAVAMVLGGTAWAFHEPESPCETLRTATLPGWDDAQRTDVARALVEGRPGYGAAASRIVEGELDRYAADWRDAQVDACQQAPTAPEAASERRACLDRLGGQLAALTKHLAVGDAGVVEHAASATQALVPVASCALVDGRSRGPSPAPAQQAAVAEVRGKIDRVRAQVLINQFDANPELAREAVEEARAIGHGATLAEALLVQGRLERQSGAAKQARPLLLEALSTAERHAADLLVIDVLYELVHVDLGRSRVEAAEGLLQLVEGKLDRVGEPPEMRAPLHTARGRLAYAAGRFDAAVQHYEVALQLIRAQGDEGNLRVEWALDNLANALDAAGRPAEARAAFVAELESLEAGLDQGPATAHSSGYLNLAIHDLEAGDREAASQGFSRTLEILQGAGITAGPTVARAEQGLAAVRYFEGDTEAAWKHAEVAAAAALDDETPLRLDIESLRAALLQDRGDYRTAIERYERVIEILSASEEPDLVARAMIHSNIGECLLLLDSAEGARERFEAALAALEPLVSPDDERLAYPLRGMGDVLLAEGRPAEAQVVLERALGVRKTSPDERNLAEIQWGLARARWESAPAIDRNRVRAEARALARAAFTTLSTLEPGSPRVQTIKAWLE